MFKASDYRISPFELESVLIEHRRSPRPPSSPRPDELRLAVPKAYVVLVAGYEPSEELARDILRHSRENLAPYKRIRRLQFADLPKTISGKIRRVELRSAEAELSGRPEGEYREEDFNSMSPWDHFYQFWISQQTIPGNILGDVLLGGATYLVGKYKVAPWLHKRHQEHLDQKERQHQEIVDAHQRLFELHQQQHQELQEQHRELLDATRQAVAGGPIQTSPAPMYDSDYGRMDGSTTPDQ